MMKVITYEIIIYILHIVGKITFGKQDSLRYCFILRHSVLLLPVSLDNKQTKQMIHP